MICLDAGSNPARSTILFMNEFENNQGDWYGFPDEKIPNAGQVLCTVLMVLCISYLIAIVCVVFSAWDELSILLIAYLAAKTVSCLLK